MSLQIWHGGEQAAKRLVDLEAGKSIELSVAHDQRMKKGYPTTLLYTTSPKVPLQSSSFRAN